MNYGSMKTVETRATISLFFFSFFLLLGNCEFFDYLCSEIVVYWLLYPAENAFCYRFRNTSFRCSKATNLRFLAPLEFQIRLFLFIDFWTGTFNAFERWISRIFLVFPSTAKLTDRNLCFYFIITWFSCSIVTWFCTIRL